MLQYSLLYFSQQVQLQNMLTSKYIAHFLAEVSSWQKKLSTADQVIGIWMEVQRTWSHLESIFIGSEDIRNQLPEDSKRFDGIDTDFKVGEQKCHLSCIVFQNIQLKSRYGYIWHRNYPALLMCIQVFPTVNGENFMSMEMISFKESPLLIRDSAGRPLPVCLCNFSLDNGGKALISCLWK